MGINIKRFQEGKPGCNFTSLFFRMCQIKLIHTKENGIQKFSSNPHSRENVWHNSFADKY